MEILGALVVLLAALFAVVQAHSNAGQVGLSISFAIALVQHLAFMVRMASEFEQNIVAVERIHEYAEGGQEAPRRQVRCKRVPWMGGGVAPDFRDLQTLRKSFKG